MLGLDEVGKEGRMMRIPFRGRGAFSRSESSQCNGNRLSERIRKHAPIEKKHSF